MAAPRDRKHILVPGGPKTEKYRPHGKKITPPPLPAVADRAAHGAALSAALREAQAAAAERRQAAGIGIAGSTPSVYVEFNSVEDVRLELSTLEAQRSGIELVSVRHETVLKNDGTLTTQERATVIVPDRKLTHFLKRFEAYAEGETTKSGAPRYKNMLDRISQVRLATLNALWTDTGSDFPPMQESRWWEIWLVHDDGNEITRFSEFCALADIPVSERRLQFSDRTVVLAKASAEQLALSLDVLNDLAELRSVHQPAGFFLDLPASGQTEWVDELLARTTTAPDGAPAVCILDTGVNRGHPLLELNLAVDDLHTCNPNWNVADHNGHGTEMAGLGLYGNLAPLCAGNDPVPLRHRLESVKILPPNAFPATPPELYGAVTAMATSLVEISAPARKRCFSMSVGADPNGERGQPTSWSAAVDALAAGRSFDPQDQGLDYLDVGNDRLFIISAGNVDPSTFSTDYLTQSDLAHVEDPAQAWNAVAVGAYTNLTAFDDAAYAGWTALATAGGLSPWSRTSVGFDTHWPNKPDVVCEGGNVLFDGTDDYNYQIPDLCLLTTDRNHLQSPFTISWATSAACAQVARIAGEISAEYPELWPQTVRGLIVHSAEWTDAMRKHLQANPGKTGRSAIVRRYGFGVPRIDRALRSASDALTLLIQGTIHPFTKGSMREIQIYTLPWPKEALAALAEQTVTMRVTLSYFIEPNPSRRGWRNKYRYQSHGLRFAIKGAAEKDDDFHKRLNEDALAEDEAKPNAPADTGWFLGPITRNRGSLHCDIWSGAAADLAEREVIAVYPVSGWWKDQQSHDRSEAGVHYALIVSIETSAVDVDIWTPVAQRVGIAIPI